MLQVEKTTVQLGIRSCCCCPKKWAGIGSSSSSNNILLFACEGGVYLTKNTGNGRAMGWEIKYANVFLAVRQPTLDKDWIRRKSMLFKLMTVVSMICQ